MAVHLTSDAVHEFIQPYQDVCDDYSRVKRLNDLLTRKVELLERELSRLGLSSAAKMATSAAFERWSEHLVIKSQRQRLAVLRRVRFVCEQLKVPLGELTSEAVNKAVISSMKTVRSRSGRPATSSYEHSYRVRDFKRFIIWCSDEFDLPMLARLVRSLKPVGIEKLARQNGRNADILEIQKVQVLLQGTECEPFESLTASTYWRAMLATFVYGGLRLAELCTLTWDRVDFNNDLVAVLDCEIKACKTIQSNRPIRPLPELWPFLRALQPITGKYNLVFPAYLEGKLRDESWLIEEDGKMIGQRLTRVLIRMESVFGLGRRIPTRARRTCRNLMINRGVPLPVLNAMMGHDGRVGAAHYENALQIVSGFRYA